ncbi:hypothetical protein RhiirC2_761746 [Rhizophagus irregularis]|uniref:HTH cro/C1-type domain-containing protein n=1 Tax=Rhizophagus irregularis TaxID=588596 RepID=A0A2N1MFT6_9GLOM|nr:hypothetical protein RhiirC2_761746 [Rhizophagus irregularis]
MATNREREAEQDLDIREKQIRDREIMARKGQEEYYKDRRARELAMDEADRLREQQEIELEKHRLQTLESSLKTDEDFDDEEGIESKRKRRILVPSIEYIKKIVKYLGVQEDELISFIIDHLRNKKTAEDLTKEMMMVC